MIKERWRALKERWCRIFGHDYLIRGMFTDRVWCKRCGRELKHYEDEDLYL